MEWETIARRSWMSVMSSWVPLVDGHLGHIYSSMISCVSINKYFVKGRISPSLNETEGDWHTMRAMLSVVSVLLWRLSSFQKKNLDNQVRLGGRLSKRTRFSWLSRTKIVRHRRRNCTIMPEARDGETVDCYALRSDIFSGRHIRPVYYWTNHISVSKIFHILLSWRS